MRYRAHLLPDGERGATIPQALTNKLPLLYPLSGFKSILRLQPRKMVGCNPGTLIGANATDIIQKNAAEYFGYVEAVWREHAGVEHHVDLLHQNLGHQVDVDVGPEELLADSIVEQLLQLG